MIDKLNELKELRARTEQRRKIWTSSVKNKIIDDMEAINKQFNLGFIPKLIGYENFETLIFRLPDRPLKIIYEGSHVIQTGAALCFSQFANGKIWVYIENSKIELLQIEMENKFSHLEILEPEAVYQADKRGFVESLITHLIDFDHHEETVASN